MSRLLDYLTTQIEVILDEGDGDVALEFLEELQGMLPLMTTLKRPSPWCDCCQDVETYLVRHVALATYLDGASSPEYLYETVSRAWDAHGMDFPVPLQDIRAYALLYHDYLLFTDDGEDEDDDLLHTYADDDPPDFPQ